MCRGRVLWVPTCRTVVAWSCAGASCGTAISLSRPSTAWDVVVTWLGLLRARGPAPLPINRQAGLLAAYLREVGEWTSLPRHPPAVRPREGLVAVAGTRPDLVG